MQDYLHEYGALVAHTVLSRCSCGRSGLTVDDAIEINLMEPELYQAGFPHDVFAKLRRRGPVLWHPPCRVPRTETELEFWALVSHKEVQEANRDWETFSASEGPALAPLPPEMRLSIVSQDPPDHTRLRKLISAGFTPRMIGRLETKISERSDKILNLAAERHEIDFVSEIAYQLPMHVIADIIGIPEGDRTQVFALTDSLLQSLDPAAEATLEQRQAIEFELYTYAHSLTESKRANPTDDVWSILANGGLDGFELDVFFLILTFAGSETTRTALTQGLMILLDNPDQLQDLRANPEIQPIATEEILRWTAPVLAFGRTVMRDVEFGGQQLRAGDRVGLFYPSANHDEAVFAEPSRFDVRRQPNPHVTFGGGGPHFCLGAHLARTEINTMMGSLLRRFSDIEIVGSPSWMSAGAANAVGVAVQRLPIRLS
jgi:cytochrome P450